MSLKPLERMWERVEVAKDNSDDDLFNKLMYTGELVTKLIVSGMVATVQDDWERQQYRLKYKLVRSDGIGDWAAVIDDILSGVPFTYVLPAARTEVQQLSERTPSGSWQYEATALVGSCLTVVAPSAEKLATKIAFRHWFNLFAQLRNKTRGHGAVPSKKLSLICADLRQSLEIVESNFSLFQRGWAFLSQSQKGKYRVTRWNDAAESLGFLKTRDGVSFSFPEGVYVHFGNDTDPTNILNVELVYSDIDAEDYFFPNGAFNGKTFEVLSYITGKSDKRDAKRYTAPVGSLPRSETQGLDDTEQRKGSIVNLPPLQSEYVTRATPEKRLYEEIIEDNQHRIITLIGRGGIGKTWLTLQVLNRIADENHFAAILWFSARDIDLLPDGAKQVQPHVLSENEVAKQFKRLIGPYLCSFDTLSSKKFDELAFLRENMTRSEIGPILFVFDNFETVKSPVELYNWLDHNLRLPNKAVITTRYREFKGDYPVELRGMSSDECNVLIDTTASRLRVTHLLTEEYRNRLYKESDGHPYVVKILLGELKKAEGAATIERILAKQDDILDALFERTYNRLSENAQRVFLTICNWKSFIPQLAIEAILLRPFGYDTETMNVEQAIEDLANSSLIERFVAEDGEVFLSVPLIARKFGERKLGVSRLKIAIQADTELLRFLGTTQETDLKHGVRPRITRLVRNIGKEAQLGQKRIEDYLPILEFIARRYPPTWLMVADEFEKMHQIDRVEQMLNSYLEFSTDLSDKQPIWQRLARLYAVHSKYEDEIRVRLELAQIPTIDYDIISEAANRLNRLLSDLATAPSPTMGESEKRFSIATLIDLMEERIHEANATDCSRLGWLYLYQGNAAKAREAAERGLSMDENNEYCVKLSKRMNGG